MGRSNAVWITGVGATTPLGSGYDMIADGLLAGRSGVRRVNTFDVSEHPSQIAGQVEQIPCPTAWEPTAFKKLPPLEQLILSCCTAALCDANCWESRSDFRIGMVIGLGAEWLEVWEVDTLQGGTRIYHPQQNRESLTHSACQKLGISGPVMSVSAACASGNYAIAQARRWLEMGWVDICLAGACDMAVTPMSLAGFGNLRALSRGAE